MSASGSGSYGHVSGGDSPSDSEDEDGVVRHDRLVRTLVGHSGSVYTVAVSPDGTRIVSGSTDSTIKVWDLASGACVRTLEGHSDMVLSVAVSSDGRHIVSGSYDKTVKIWDARHYRRVPHVLLRSQVQATHALPNGLPLLPLLERRLWHYVYGCKPDDDEAAEHDWPTLLDDLFPLVIQFLVG